MTDTQPAEPTDVGTLPVVLDVNTVVSYNITAIRERRGWTQQSVAERLGELTGHQLPQASISAMERANITGRRRVFDAHELYLLSVVFDVPITYFFMPPPGTGCQVLADTGEPVTDLYAAVIGTDAQLDALDDRLAEIQAHNVDHSDAILAAIYDTGEAVGNWRESYRTWRSHRIDDIAAQCGDRLDEVAVFLNEFATKLAASGPTGYLQSMAHRHGEEAMNTPQPGDSATPLSSSS